MNEVCSRDNGLPNCLIRFKCVDMFKLFLPRISMKLTSSPKSYRKQMDQRLVCPTLSDQSFSKYDSKIALNILQN